MKGPLAVGQKRIGIINSERTCIIKIKVPAAPYTKLLSVLEYPPAFNWKVPLTVVVPLLIYLTLVASVPPAFTVVVVPEFLWNTLHYP